SWQLVTLEQRGALKTQPDECGVHEPDCRELIGFWKGMEFTAIPKRVAAHFEVEDLDAIASDPAVAQPPHMKVELPREEPPAVPADDAAIRKPIDHSAYVTVTAAKDLDIWVARATAKSIV